MILGGSFVGGWTSKGSPRKMRNMMWMDGFWWFLGRKIYGPNLEPGSLGWSWMGLGIWNMIKWDGRWKMPGDLLHFLIETLAVAFLDWNPPQNKQNDLSSWVLQPNLGLFGTYPVWTRFQATELMEDVGRILFGGTKKCRVDQARGSKFILHHSKERVINQNTGFSNQTWWVDQSKAEVWPSTKANFTTSGVGRMPTWKAKIQPAFMVGEWKVFILPHDR